MTPRASSTSLNGVSNGKLLVKLNAPPVDGAANKALCRFIARTLGCSRGSVEIEKGERSRDKSVLVRGVSEDTIRDVLEAQS